MKHVKAMSENTSPRPRKLKRVIIREEYVALTGDHIDAVLLHQLEYLQSQAYDIDRYLEEEGGRLAREGIDVNLLPASGWFQKSARELSAETFLNLSDSNILARLQSFVARGWLHERSNPKQKWDRRKQYRLDLVRLREDLERIGYQLEGWAIASLSPSNSTFSKTENASSVGENAFSKAENGISETENGSSKTEERYLNTSSEHNSKHTHKHAARTVIDEMNRSPRLPAGESVCSRYTLEECLRFAEHLRSSGQGINNPGGYATKIHRTGEADALIAKFQLGSSRHSQVDLTKCADCRGTGYWYPGGHQKGVAKCHHPKLLSESKLEQANRDSASAA